MSNRTNNLVRRNYAGFIFISLSIGAFYASYFNFYFKEGCSYGGSKLSWLFGIVCESFGQAGISVLWLIAGIFAFVIGTFFLFRR
ncbi:MAG: hypothetical protein B0W54_24015 [Cellvibrio sp. 79]|nr:MAG: hypothetical protein B0W54_24015 [Cellvibrio sp. 79]